MEATNQEVITLESNLPGLRRRRSGAGRACSGAAAGRALAAEPGEVGHSGADELRASPRLREPGSERSCCPWRRCHAVWPERPPPPAAGARLGGGSPSRASPGAWARPALPRGPGSAGRTGTRQNPPDPPCPAQPALCRLRSNGPGQGHRVPQSSRAASPGRLPRPGQWVRGRTRFVPPSLVGGLLFFFFFRGRRGRTRGASCPPDPGRRGFGGGLFL